jgi:TPP-dependent pyruvate/acetoin dehydrogenase alpha subunit
MSFPPHPRSPKVPPPPIGHVIASQHRPSGEVLLDVFRAMSTSRRVESRVVELYRQNRITGGCYTGIGNEATSVGLAWPMIEGDVLVPTHRDMGAHLVRGHGVDEIMLQYMKRATSMTGGKDSGLHMGREGTDIVGMISHLAHMMPVAVGVALAERQQGKTSCVVTTVGDGSTSLGDFHESLNFAAVQKLPVVFVIENNQYAYSTPVTIQHAAPRLSDRALGYGMAGEQIDGTDVIAVLDAVSRALDRGRSGGGPTLIESVTMRMRGHSEHDDFRYVPKELIEAWKTWDPLTRTEEHLLREGLIDREGLGRIQKEIDEAIDRAVEAAERAPLPNGPEAEEGLFREWRPEWTVPNGITVLEGEAEAEPREGATVLQIGGGRR